MGRKILVEFELGHGDLSFEKDIRLIEHIIHQHSYAFKSAKIISPKEHLCRTPREIQECIERNKKAWEERTNG